MFVNPFSPRSVFKSPNVKYSPVTGFNKLLPSPIALHVSVHSSIFWNEYEKSLSLPGNLE